MNCRYCGVSIVDPHHPWPPQKCTECQISDSHDSDEKIQRIDRLRRDKARLMKALTLAINRFETIADGIDNGDCDSIAPTLLRRAANTADKALKGEK